MQGDQKDFQNVGLLSGLCGETDNNCGINLPRHNKSCLKLSHFLGRFVIKNRSHVTINIYGPNFLFQITYAMLLSGFRYEWTVASCKEQEFQLKIGPIQCLLHSPFEPTKPHLVETVSDRTLLSKEFILDKAELSEATLNLQKLIKC
jgi:hypothetical protein